MTPEEAIKRLRQETCPATYNPDFDKEQCLQVLENELTLKNSKSKVEYLITKVYLKTQLESWLELLNQDGCNSKEQVEKEIKEMLDQLEN